MELEPGGIRPRCIRYVSSRLVVVSATICRDAKTMHEITVKVNSNALTSTCFRQMTAAVGSVVAVCCWVAVTLHERMDKAKQDGNFRPQPTGGRHVLLKIRQRRSATITTKCPEETR
jgi:hypothetical protein